jgi:hypothetical protein
MYNCTCPNCFCTIELATAKLGETIKCECKTKFRVKALPSESTKPRTPVPLALVVGASATLGLVIAGLFYWFTAPQAATARTFAWVKSAQVFLADPAPKPRKETREKEPNTVESLLKRLQATDNEDRIKAIQTIGLLRPKATKAVSELLDILRDPKEDPKIREATYAALMEIGQPEGEHLDLLVESIKDSTCVEGRRYAASMLGYFGEKAKETKELLVKALTDADKLVRLAMLDSIKRIGKDFAQDLYQDVFQVLKKDADEQVRLGAMNTILNLERPTDSNPDDLKSVLTTPGENKQVRMYAIYELIKIGKKYQDVIVDTFKTEKNAEVLAYSLDKIHESFTIAKDQPVTAELCQNLMICLESEHRIIRHKAAALISGVGRVRMLKAEFLPCVLAALGSSDEKIWEPISRHLIGRWSAFPPLDDKDLPKEPTTRDILMLNKECLPALQKALGSEDLTTRRFATYALGSLEVDGCPAAVQLYYAFSKEKNYDLQFEMILTFGLLGAGVMDQLGDLSGRLKTDLKKIADGEGDSRRTPRQVEVIRKLAAIALLQIAPTSEESKSTNDVIRDLLMLKGVPPEFLQREKLVLVNPFSPMWGSSWRLKSDNPAKGRQAAGPSHVDHALFELTKRGLVNAKSDCIPDLVSWFKSTYTGNRDDSEQKRSERAIARTTVYQIIAKIGKDIDPRHHTAIRSLFGITAGFVKKNQEVPSVIDAAKHALEVLPKKTS